MATTKLHKVQTRTLVDEQNTDQWLKERSKRITATSVAPILGIGPRTIQELYMDKTLERTKEPNPAMALGTYMEPYILRAYEQKEAISVIELGLIAHPTIPWLAVSPDGWRSDGALLEMKCTTSRILRDKPPEYYRIQCLTQLEAIPEAAFCDLFEVKIEEQCSVHMESWRDYQDTLGRNWRIVDWRCHRIYRDQAWFASILPKVKQFHDDVQFVLQESNYSKRRRSSKSSSPSSASASSSSPSSASSSITTRQGRKRLRLRRYSDDQPSYSTATLAHCAIGDHVSVRFDIDDSTSESNTIAKMISIKKQQTVHQLMESIQGSIYMSSAHTDMEVIRRTQPPAIFFATFEHNGITARIDALIDETLFNGTKSSSSLPIYTLCYIKCKKLTSSEIPRTRDWNYLRVQRDYDRALLERIGINMSEKTRIINDQIKLGALSSVELDESDNLKINEQQLIQQIEEIRGAPHIEQLPGMGIRMNNGWMQTKRQLARTTNHVSFLPGIKEEQLRILADHGIHYWNQPNALEPLLSKSQGKHQNKCQEKPTIVRWRKLIQWNTDPSSSTLHIENKASLETSMGTRDKYLHVYMDVETTGSVSLREDRSWIFMFGLSHKTPDNKLHYERFIMKELTESEEQRIAIAYYDYLDKLRAQYPTLKIRVCHWGHIECSVLKGLAARYRRVPTFDPIMHVNMEALFRKVPILVKDVFTTKLKDVSTALVGANYKELNVQNGCDAMEAASRIYQQEHIEPSDWVNIIHYNQLDCETLYHIHNKLC